MKPLIVLSIALLGSGLFSQLHARPIKGGEEPDQRPQFSRAQATEADNNIGRELKMIARLIAGKPKLRLVVVSRTSPRL